MSPPGLIEDASGFSDESTVDDSSGSEASSGSGEASLGSGGSIGTDESSSGDPTDLSSGERITSSLMTEGEVGSLVLILVAVAIGFLLVVLTVAAVYRYCAPPTPESKPDVDEGQVTWLSGAARRDPGLEGGRVAAQVAPGGETAGVESPLLHRAPGDELSKQVSFAAADEPPTLASERLPAPKLDSPVAR